MLELAKGKPGSDASADVLTNNSSRAGREPAKRMEGQIGHPRRRADLLPVVVDAALVELSALFRGEIPNRIGASLDQCERRGSAVVKGDADEAMLAAYDDVVGMYVFSQEPADFSHRQLKMAGSEDQWRERCDSVITKNVDRRLRQEHELLVRERRYSQSPTWTDLQGGSCPDIGRTGLRR